MDRLLAFIRATSFRAPDVDPEHVAGVVQLALAARTDREFVDAADDRVLVKLAALGIAFYQELGTIVRGEFELDHREEAILEAVIAHLKREAS
jgi:hypothetical protein